MSMKDIDSKFLERCRMEFLSDKSAGIAARAVMTEGPIMASMRPGVVRSLPYVFSLDLDERGITDQGKSARCWAFASLNAVRQQIAQSLDMEDQAFELSQGHTYFYDQLEKCARVLDEAICRADEPLDSPDMYRLCKFPIVDNGQWSIWADIADKYGLVPKAVMPDTECLPDTRYVTRILGDKLRLGIKKIRSARERGASTGELYKVREHELEGVYAILTRFLGLPPERFTFEYRDRQGKFHRIVDITPVEFARKYCGHPTSEYVMLIHHPSEKRPFMRTYYIDPYDHKVPHGKSHGILLNTDMPLFKQAVIDQLKGGEQVVIGCDVAQQSDKAVGVMDANLLAFEETFGTDLYMDKADRIKYHGTRGTHIMTISGVNLGKPDGSPDRWKIQNSYGLTTKFDGHYVMSDSWFDEWVLSAVIRKCFLPPELLKVYEEQHASPMKITEWY